VTMKRQLETARAPEVEPIDTPEGVMRPLLFGAQASLIHLEVPSGTEVPPHGHPNEGLAYCLSGEVELTLLGATILLAAESAIRVPAGESVGMRNPGPEPAKLLLVSAPPAASSLEELRGLVGPNIHRNAGQ